MFSPSGVGSRSCILSLKLFLITKERAFGDVMIIHVRLILFSSIHLASFETAAKSQYGDWWHSHPYSCLLQIVFSTWISSPPAILEWKTTTIPSVCNQFSALSSYEELSLWATLKCNKKILPYKFALANSRPEDDVRWRKKCSGWWRESATSVSKENTVD